MPKMEFRAFDGEEDAYWWVLCIEEHFDVNGTSEEEKLTKAMNAMRGRAFKWWLWWNCVIHK